MGGSHVKGASSAARAAALETRLLTARLGGISGLAGGCSDQIYLTVPLVALLSQQGRRSGQTWSLTYPTVSARNRQLWCFTIALSPFVLSGMQAQQETSNKSLTTSDGIKLAYVHAGSRTSAPVVVLIHGWSGSKAYWELNVGGLAKHCKVYA